MKNPLRFCSTGFVFLLSVVSVVPVSAQEAKGALRQTEETFVHEPASPATLRYLQYLPKGYEQDPEKKWPLMIFLHGAGERGDNLDLVKVHGPPKRIEAGDEFPFIVVSPQCPAEGWWPWQPVNKLIDSLEKTLRVDPDRIYLTGLSMGGYGTWATACQRPDRFAAIVPICGGGTPYLMRRITHVPVWAFHGGKDTAVILDESKRLVEELEKFGNKQVRFTVYPEAGHDSWTKSYDNPELYEWLLAQRRSAGKEAQKQ